MALSGSDSISLASLFVAAMALGLSWYAIYRGNRNGSAASLIALNEAFRQAWQRYIGAKDEQQLGHEFAELANLIELACALDLDATFTGRSNAILREYLDSIMDILNDNDDAKRRLVSLIDSATAFIYIRKWIKKRGNLKGRKSL